MENVIKSYLVSLGFKVDDASFEQVENSIKKVESTIKKFSSSAVSSFGKAEAGFVGFIVAANIGIAKFISGLAQADLKNEMLARQMWTTRTNAESFNNTIKAMGVSMEDLYLSPELMKGFKELRSEVAGLKPPPEFQEQMKFIRSIKFEFSRLKLEATYALQWIGYYFIKYMSGPLSNIKISLHDINDAIVKRMPEWTKVIAQGLSWIARLGLAGFGLIKGIIKLFNAIPTSLKIAAVSIKGFFSILSMGPVGLIIVGLTALLLLLDDYNTYESGGDSLFAGMWESFDKIKKQLSDIGIFAGFKKTIDDLGETVGKLGDSFLIALGSLGSLGDSLAKMLGFKDFNDFVKNILQTTLEGIKATIDGINTALKVMNDLLHLDVKGAATKTTEGFYGNKETAEAAGNATDKLFKRDFKGWWAESDIGRALKNSDSISSFFGQIIKQYSPDSTDSSNSFEQLIKQYQSNASNSPQKTGVSYMYPKTSSTVKISSPVTTTFNITGNNPEGIARTVGKNLNTSIMMRNTRGIL